MDDDVWGRGGKVSSVKVKTVEERDVSFSTRSSLICNNVSIRIP